MELVSSPRAILGGFLDACFGGTFLMELIQPSRFLYFLGLLVSIFMLASSIWILTSEIQNLTQSVAAEKLLISYHANSGFLPGGLIAGVAIAITSIWPLFGKQLSSTTNTVIGVMFVIAVFAGITGRLLGNQLVGSYLSDQNYTYCREKSTFGPRLRKEGWVLDAGLCDLPFDIEGLTQPELNRSLAD